MNAAIQDAIKEQSFVDLLAKSGATPVFKNATNSAKEVKEEGSLMARIVKDANIKIENYQLVILDEDLLALLHDRGQRHDDDDERGDDEQRQRDRWRRKTIGSPLENTSARRKCSSRRSPSTKPSRNGAGSQSSL